MIEFIVWAMLNFGGIYFGAWGLYLWWKYIRKASAPEPEKYEPVVINLGKIPAGAKITGIEYNEMGNLNIDLADGSKLTFNIPEKMKEHGRDTKGR